MTINVQQRESYRQALEAWKIAARDAQRTKDRLYNASTGPDNLYVITSDELQRLQREYEHYLRLQSIVRAF